MNNRTRLHAIAAIFLLAAAGIVYCAGETEKPAKSDRPTKELAASRQTALVTAAEKASCSVVSIGAERTGYIRRRSFADSFFHDSFPSYEKFRQKTPYLGSGIVVDAQGHVVTNYHVVEGAEKVFVTLSDGEEQEAKIVDYDLIADLVILKTETKNACPAILGDSDDVRLGEWALAIGNPYGGLLGTPTPTITSGVISATNRFFRTQADTPHLYEGMIQTDAAINPGNSGGALVNAAGEVIGVNTFIFSESGGSVGIGFAIPINKVKQMLEEIEKYGHLRSIRLDFDTTDITRYLAQTLSLSSFDGVVVLRVEKMGPAAAAGIESGDVITSVNGRAVADRRAFLVHFLSARVGEKLTLEVLREKKKVKLSYEVQEERKKEKDEQKK